MNINKTSSTTREIDDRLFLLHSFMKDYESVLKLISNKILENDKNLQEAVILEDDKEIKQQLNSQPETLLGENYINSQHNELVTKSFFLILYSFFEDGFSKILLSKLEQEGNCNSDLFELISKEKIDSVKKVYSKIYGVEFGKKPFQNIWEDILILKNIRNKFSHNDLSYSNNTINCLKKRSLWKNESLIIENEIIQYLYNTVESLFELLKIEFKD